jgi:hypothetical protein
MTATTAMIAQDAPVLEASDGVLDPGSTSTMATPCSVSQDPVSAKPRRDELGDSAVSTVGEHATMLLAKRLDVRSAVVHRVVAVAWATCDRVDDSQIAPADQDLGVARPAVVLGTGRPSMVAGRDQRAIDHPRFGRSVGQLGAASAARRGVIVETIRCAADFEIAKLAASSRTVRLVRSAAHVIKMRCASEHDHGRPC